MMKLRIDKARVHVSVSFWAKGSVLAETVETECKEVTARLEIESQEDPEKIAKLARVSEQGCYVIQSLRKPTPISYSVVLNGQSLSRVHD